MKGLKDFYSKNEKIIFWVLLIIAAVLGYKCYQKYQSKKEVAAIEEEKSEKYRYITTVGELANIELESGLGDFRNIRLGEGSRARDPAFLAVNEDIQNIGSSGFDQPGESKGLDYGKFTAYGGQSIGYY